MTRLARTTLALLLLLAAAPAFAGPPSPGLSVTTIGVEAFATVDNPATTPRDVVGITLLRTPDGRVKPMEYHGAGVSYLPGLTVAVLGEMEIDDTPGVTMIEVAILDALTGETLARVIQPVAVRP